MTLPLDTIIEGDCLDVLRTLPDVSVDAVVTDPPYGTTACKWDAVIPLDAMWRELRRVLRHGGPIILFASQPFTSAVVMSNPRWFRHEWIWHKSTGHGFLNANRMPLKRHESVLVFCERQPYYRPEKTPGRPYRARTGSAGETTFDKGISGWETVNDGWRHPTSVLRFQNDRGLHPTQKPVALLAYLIRTYTRPSETVLDFTCGSGSTCVAAAQEGRRYIGIEREAAYVAIARQRLAAVEAVA